MPTVSQETPGPTADLTATDDPSDSFWSQDPPEPLLLGTAVRVVVAELNIRDAPTTSAKRVDTFRADQVIVVDEIIPPVEADGYTWYEGAGPFGNGTGQLEPLPHPAVEESYPTSGWFAASKGTTRFVKPATARCPSDVKIANLGAMTPAERLDCFGDRTIELEGTFRYGCPTCEYFGAFDPQWLASPNEFNYISETGTGADGLGLNLRVPSGPTRPENGSIVKVRGHFDDAAADTCTLSLVPWDYMDTEADPAPRSVARLWCRQQFVVETIDVTGTDATYEGF